MSIPLHKVLTFLNFLLSLQYFLITTMQVMVMTVTQWHDNNAVMP